MRALILGGGGAIGSAIARHADGIGIETHVGLRPGTAPVRVSGQPGIRRHLLDVGDADAVQRLLLALRPDWLVMAAMPREGHAADAGSRRRLLLGMCEGVLGVLEAVRAVRFAGTVAWLGSAMAYGRAPPDAQAPLQPQTFRGAVKAAESLLVAQFAQSHGIRLHELRVFTAYGPYEQRGRLIPSLLHAALSGGRIRLATVPGQRDWIHYDDIAAACLATVAAPEPPPIVNVCNGRLHDTRAVAALLENLCGRPLVATEPYPGGDAYGRCPAAAPPAACDSIDWSPRIPLEEGLARCWAWARSPAGRAYLLADDGTPA